MAALLQHPRIARIQLMAAGVFGARLRQIVQCALRVAQIVVHRRLIGRERLGGLKMLQRLVEVARLAKQVGGSQRDMGSCKARRERERLLVRRPRVGIAVQICLDCAEGEIGARALRILGDELLRRRELSAGVILEPLPRDLDLQLLGVRCSRGKTLGTREVGLEFVE